jgi:pimeloyl-ACP methyl ester carboxylesterase
MNPYLRALACLAWLCTGGAPAAAEVVDLPTRPGVTQRVLVEQPAQPPAAVLVLMTGGAGRLGIFDNGSMRNEGNFLVRSRGLFVQQGYAVVLPDTPSDRSAFGNDFREGAEHAADLGTVIGRARQRFSRPVWIIGTSCGTQSAAHAGRTLTGPGAPDGVVLTSTIMATTRLNQSTPVPEMSLDKLRMPVLVVHHENDQCQSCPPARLPVLMDRLKGTHAKLLTYSGGVSTGAPCEPFAYHGFNGIEGQVVADIAAWISSLIPSR